MIKKRVSGGPIHNIPLDLRRALVNDEEAQRVWQNITPLARNEWICWTISVKKEETRRDHIKRVLSELKEGKSRPCCWGGCPHR